MNLTRRVALTLPAILWMDGCGAPPPPPATLDLAIHAGPDQNPIPAGVAAPVELRFYQLAGTDPFATADVFALADRAPVVLGASLLSSESRVVAPGETVNLHRDVKAGAAFLGIMALFRDIDRATWRAMAPLALHGPTRLVATTTRLAVTLSAA